MAYIDKYGVKFSDDRKTLIRCPKNFEGEYAIPYGITRIGDEAFYDCYSLISIKIPNSVTSIGTHAFWRCSGLTSVTIPNSVVNIGDDAFCGCSGLTSVTIPNGVKRIGNTAFYRCNLTSVEVEDGNTAYDSRNNCNAIIETASNTLILGRKNTIIPHSVTSIGEGAFRGCSGLTSITIPDSVTSIGDGAFCGCRGLTAVTIPNGVKSVGNHAFTDCCGLTSVTIPNGVKRIGNTAFYRCNLTSVEVEDGNAAYDSRNNCNAIIETASNTLILGCKNTIIPHNVTSIGDCAFAGCSGLTAVTIPNSVTSIGDYAFADCDNLREICVPKGQKERFVKMNALSEYKNIIVEDSQQGRIRTSQYIGITRIRTWDECLKEWDENKLDYRIKNMFGIHLTIDEYNIFKKENRNIEQIHGWCNSGKYIHEMERLCSHLPSSDNPSGVGNNIGLKTPRKGFYRVIDVLDDKECTLVCYYNYHDPDEFVEEEVEISSRPLYNKSSIGPKDHLLKVGDILHVKEYVQLVEAKYDGKVYTAYKIVWDYEN